MDRDGKFTAKFREVLNTAGVEPVCLPPRSPNLNAFADDQGSGLFDLLRVVVVLVDVRGYEELIPN